MRYEVTKLSGALDGGVELCRLVWFNSVVGRLLLTDLDTKDERIPREFQTNRSLKLHELHDLTGNK